MADRYTYLPAVGIFVAVVWVVAEAAKSVGLDRRLLASGVVVVLATLCLLAARQVRFWKSSYDLWSHTLQVTVNNFVAEENLGQSLVAMGQYDEALPHFLNAEMIDGGDPTAQSNLGSALLRRGRYSEAIEHFDAVTRLTNDPSYLVDAYKGMGVASAQLGDRAKARDYFLQTLRFNSQDPTNVYNLSLLEVEVGIDKMAHSLSVHPTAPGYLQLAQLLQEDHKISDAQDAYQKALQLDPSLEEAKQALIRLKSDPK
jgi:tetratricopeptide (TPR) repeat protein